MAQCGEKPQLIAIGIAPLGIISIGVVPMGVVSIGVVPMGVLSLGAVGMGLINACVVGMGVITAGVNVMGLWTLSPRPDHGHHHRAAESNLTAYRSKAVALRKAERLGCQGVHRMGSLWMPCAEHPASPPTGSVP